MSEKNKFRGAFRKAANRTKCKPEPSFESRIRNRPELQDRIDEERRAKLLALAPSALVTPAVVDAQIAALVVGEPAEAPQQEPLEPGGGPRAAEDDQHFVVTIVGDPSGDEAATLQSPSVTRVMHDASLGEIGGSGEAEAAEGDGPEVTHEPAGSGEDAVAVAPVDEGPVESEGAPSPEGDDL